MNKMMTTLSCPKSTHVERDKVFQRKYTVADMGRRKVYGSFCFISASTQ